MSSSALDRDILKQVFQSAKVNKNKPNKARTRAILYRTSWFNE